MFVAVLALALARGFLAVAEIVFVLFDFAFDARLALIGVSLLTSGLLSKMVAAAEIGRAHVLTPVTLESRMPSSA